MLARENKKQPKLLFFHRIAPINNKFTILTSKCMFLRVAHPNRLFVTKNALFRVGLTIQDGC